MKKSLKLNRQTLKSLDMEKASGGVTAGFCDTTWFCDTTSPCAVSRGFTNCPSCCITCWTYQSSTCAFCPK